MLDLIHKIRTPVSEKEDAIWHTERLQINKERF